MSYTKFMFLHKMQQIRQIFWISEAILLKNHHYQLSHHGFPGGSVDKESACSVGDPGSIPELGWSPEDGNGNPLLHSCLGNPMDIEAWWAIVHGITRVGRDLVTKPPTSDFKKSQWRKKFCLENKEVNKCSFVWKWGRVDLWVILFLFLFSNFVHDLSNKKAFIVAVCFRDSNGRKSFIHYNLEMMTFWLQCNKKHTLIKRCIGKWNLFSKIWGFDLCEIICVSRTCWKKPSTA